MKADYWIKQGRKFIIIHTMSLIIFTGAKLIDQL